MRFSKRPKSTNSSSHNNVPYIFRKDKQPFFDYSSKTKEPFFSKTLQAKKDIREIESNIKSNDLDTKTINNQIPKEVQKKNIIQRQENNTTSDRARDVTMGTATVIEVEAVLRDLYKRTDEAIYKEAKHMISKGMPENEVAKWVIKSRNTAKVKIRKFDLDVLRIMAEQRNIRRYGDPVGPNYKDLTEGNQSKGIKPKTNNQIIEAGRKTNKRVNRWVGRFRIAGRIMIAVDIGIAAYQIANTPKVERPKALLKETGGILGAAVGGWAGAKLGGAIGAGIGSFFFGAGAVPGAAIGAFIGGLGGAIGGGLLGRKAGSLIANDLYPPKQTNFEGSFR